MTVSHAAEVNAPCHSFMAPADGSQAAIVSSPKTDLLRQLFEGEALRSRSHEVRIEPRRDLAREGEAQDRVSLLLDGWAARYKQLNDGRRQVLSLILPGELCDADVSRTGELDYSISTLTPVTVRQISRPAFNGLLDSQPAFARAVWRGDRIREAIQRELLLSLGRRTAKERIAHLLVETFLRLQALGRSHEQECEFPLTQADIADMLGITPVHVNRTLQALRREGLVVLGQRRLSLLSPSQLMRLAHLNAKYLRLALAPDEEEQAQMVRWPSRQLSDELPTESKRSKMGFQAKALGDCETARFSQRADGRA